MTSPSAAAPSSRPPGASAPTSRSGASGSPRSSSPGADLEAARTIDATGKHRHPGRDRRPLAPPRAGLHAQGGHRHRDQRVRRRRRDDLVCDAQRPAAAQHRGAARRDDRALRGALDRRLEHQCRGHGARGDSGPRDARDRRVQGVHGRRHGPRSTRTCRASASTTTASCSRSSRRSGPPGCR